jgi:hypothetical protein
MKRAAHLLIPMSALFSSAAAAVGCFDYLSDSRLYLQEPGPDGVIGTGGEGGGGTTTTISPECVPAIASLPVDDMCGVFVSAAGNDSNDGTKAAPVKTLLAALAKANGLPVYACNDGGTGAVVLTEDATVYGGLDCAQGWRYAGLEKKTPWSAGANEIPLRLSAGVRAELYDVVIAAADATAAGGSSIGVLAEVGTQLALERCEVNAGNGADGAEGEAPMGTGAVGVSGGDGSGDCDEDVIEIQGFGGQLTCDATNVAGGDGGSGTKNMTGGAGSPGLPIGTGGTAGLGQGVSVDCATDGNGGAGTPGTSGTPGQGASASLGTLGPSGVSGIAGNDGLPGAPGQGGGGGGGGKACANTKAGPSGGGGGSGGCGGAGGKGGKPGGSSIALVSLGAKLRFESVQLTAKNGGKGGAGGAGQPGGAGGNGGMPGMGDGTGAACAGGKGGDGGLGGRGGGGLGGHSIGIAHAGEAPDTAGATITMSTAGSGGLGEGDMGTGAPGKAAPVQSF